MNSVILRGDFRPGLLSRLSAAIRGWVHNRRAIRELNALPDALLMDIGIERHQIRDAVMQSGPYAEVTSIRKETATEARTLRQAA